MSRRLLLTLLTAALGLAAWVGQALAAGPPTVLSLQVPASAELGEEVTITATLRAADGKPLSGARVFFWMPAEFAGVAGTMDLGSGVTDAEGTAVFRYAARQSGVVTLAARFPGDALSGASEATASLTVSGVRQLYIAEAGVRMPVLSVLWLAGALAVVFGLYTTVGLLIFGIAREGGGVAAPARRDE